MSISIKDIDLFLNLKKIEFDPYLKKKDKNLENIVMTTNFPGLKEYNKQVNPSIDPDLFYYNKYWIAVYGPEGRLPIYTPLHALIGSKNSIRFYCKLLESKLSEDTTMEYIEKKSAIYKKIIKILICHC